MERLMIRQLAGEAQVNRETLGLPEEISEIEVCDSAQVAELALPGSPTIRLDDKDVETRLPSFSIETMTSGTLHRTTEDDRHRAARMENRKQTPRGTLYLQGIPSVSSQTILLRETRQASSRGTAGR